MATNKPLYMDAASQRRLVSESGALLFLEIETPSGGGGAGWPFRAPSGQQPKPRRSDGRGGTYTAVGDSWRPRQQRNVKVRLRIGHRLVAVATIAKAPRQVAAIEPAHVAAPRVYAPRVSPSISVSIHRQDQVIGRLVMVFDAVQRGAKLHMQFVTIPGLILYGLDDSL